MRRIFTFTLHFFLLLSFFAIPSILNASPQSDWAEVQKQIEHESAILKQDPNAAPSPKLKELQKKAIQIQRAITTKTMQNLESASQKEASKISDNLVKHKENIKKAADGAISVMDALSDELGSESEKLKIQIGKITDHRDVTEFLSKAGNDSKDAKRVRRLNQKIEQLNQRQNKIKQDRNRLTGVKSLLEKGKTGLDAISMVNNLKDGKYLETTEDALGIIQDYLPDHSGKIKALDATTKLLSETSGGTKSINKKLGKEMGRLSAYSDKLKRVEKLGKGIDVSLKAIGYIKKAKEFVNKAAAYQKQFQALKDDGTTTKAGRNLIMGMDVVGEGIKGLAGYLPPGAKDFVEFYGDAMKLPGTVNKIAKKWYKDRDEAVNVTGPLAQTKAGREYPGILDRDPELNPDGNLGVYYDPEKKCHVLITDPDKPAVVISEKERDRIAQINSDLTATGKKLTNGMIAELRKNGYQKIVIPGMLSNEEIDLKDLAKLATKKREEARIKALAAEALGIKNPSKKDLADYARFDDKLNFSQRLHNYHITDQQKKRLFAKFQDDPKGFDEFLKNYAKKKEDSALIPQLTKAQKEEQAAKDRAKKLGIHSEDLTAYFNCLCRDCGGSLGGRYDPSWEGGGQGPCVCSGPLSMWKTPMNSSRDAALKCFNSITKNNYMEDQAVFKKWHKKAMIANADSVQPEVDQVRSKIATMNKTWQKDAVDAAETFNQIKPMMLDEDIKQIQKVLTPRLINAAHYNMVDEGNLKKGIKRLELAQATGGKEDLIKRRLADYKRWEKTWGDVVSKKIPEIKKLIREGNLKQAMSHMENVQFKMSTQGGNYYPPTSDPRWLALTDLYNQKKAQLLQERRETMKKQAVAEKKQAGANPEKAGGVTTTPAETFKPTLGKPSTTENYPSEGSQIQQQSTKNIKNSEKAQAENRLEKSRSTPKSVKNGSDSLSLPNNSFEPGQEISLKFTASPDYPEKSWIGMFKADLPHDGMEKNNNHELAFQYLEKKQNSAFSFTAPSQEGNYDFRMFEKSSKREVATIDFSVAVNTDAASLSMPKHLYGPGEKITLKFTASPNYPEKSWIGMFKADLPHDGMEKNNNHELAFQYLEKKQGGTFSFAAPSQEGEYDFRMFEKSSKKEVATIDFSVAVNTGAASLTLPKHRYEPGEKMTLAFTASPDYPEKSWIGMFKADLPHDGMEKNNNHELAFQYLEKKQDGTFSFAAPSQEGEYDFRMFEKSSKKEVATIDFSVAVNTDAASLTLPKHRYEPGERITLKFTASSNYPEKSWIGMFKADLPHDGMEKNNNHELAFQYLEKKQTGAFSFNAPSQEGAYDFRMFERSSKKEIATIKFNVKK